VACRAADSPARDRGARVFSSADLADASKMGLSFHRKRPGPGPRLDTLSLQFAMHDTGLIGDVLTA
jgi:hypothetical protein